MNVLKFAKTRTRVFRCDDRRRPVTKSTILTFLRPIFFLAGLDFFPPPLTAPGSPRMR